MKKLMACALLAAIVGFAECRPPQPPPQSSSSEEKLPPETKRQLLQLSDELYRKLQRREFNEFDRELEQLDKILEGLNSVTETSDRHNLGWGPLETSDDTAAAIDQLTTLVIDGVLTAVKELDDSFLEGQILGESSETVVSDDETNEEEKMSKPSVFTNNNVLYDDSPHRIFDIENNLQTENEYPRGLLFESDNTEDNRLVKRATVEERHREIDAFLSELEKDIDKQNKGKHDVSSYIGSQYSAPKITTTERPFWKKVGDALSSSYDKVKTKTKDVMTSVKGHF